MLKVLSIPIDTSFLPSGLNARCSTPPLCTVSSTIIGSNVYASHMWIDGCKATSPVAMSLLSGCFWMQEIFKMCP